MECSFCQRTFHKGEHLRRHERSHTGLKPYACKHCSRSFSRQDSLTRHEKLHARESTVGILTPDEASGRKVVTPPSAKETTTANAPALWPGNVADPTYGSPPLSNVSRNEHHTIPTPHHYHSPQKSQAAPNLPQNALNTADLDFELFWPDSEDLFQTLMSQDTSTQWQMPFGLLPFPSESTLLAHNANTSSSNAVPLSLDDRMSGAGTISTGVNDQALRHVRMVTNPSSSLNAAIDGTSINSVFLDESLHMFFLKFIPTFPVLHRATFSYRDCIHPVLLNAIAIGSLYLGPKSSIAKGEALWKVAHASIAASWQNLIKYQGPCDACEGVQLVIAALLGQVYGALSKNRSIRTASQATRVLSFSWARRCGMFDSPARSSEEPMVNFFSEVDRDHTWRLYVGKGILHRVSLGLYVVDGLLAQMAGEPTSIRHAANQLELLGSDKAFEATTVEDWMTCLHRTESSHANITFRSVLNTLFSPQALTPTLHTSAFSLRVTLEGIQSILSECVNDTESIIGVPSKTEVRSALSRVHTTITQSTSLSIADRLETLLRWHGICLDAVVDTSTLCRELCTSWSVEQHIWTGGMPKSKIGSVRWASTEDARRALLHAVAIQEIVETLPRGRAHVVHMPASLFAASTVYAAFALSGVVTVKVVEQMDWGMVLTNNPISEFTISDTVRYIKGNDGYSGISRNMVYELNSMHKLMGCLKTQWGVASDMEAVVEKWVMLCH